MPVDTTSLARTAVIKELELLRDAVKELSAPLSEEQFWRKPLEPGNSVGHLVLHLTGNLNHFVGAQLGKTGYVRDREREFTEAYAFGQRSALPDPSELRTGLFAGDGSPSAGTGGAG